MAVELATAYISLVPSLRGAREKIKEEFGGPAATGAARAAGEKIGKEVKGGIDRAQIASSLMGIGAAGVAAGAVGATGLYKMAQATSDLEAAVATTEQVFGSASDEIQRFAETSAERFGLSKRAANEAAATLGALGKQAGLSGTELTDFSINLLKLAADMAAFKNTTVDDALGAIISGLTGTSLEPLYRYQVFLGEKRLKEELELQTGKEVNGVLTTQQRILAGNSLLYKDAADQIGQFTREQGQLGTETAKATAALEDAQAELGEQLAPMFAKLTQAASGALGTLSDLPAPLQQIVATVGAAGTVFALGGGSLALLVGGGMRAIDTFRELNTRLGETAIAGTRAATALKGITVGVGVVASIVALDAALSSASQSSVELGTNLDLLRGAETGAQGLDLLIERTKELDGLWQDIKGTFTGESFVTIGEGADAANVSVTQLKAALQQYVDAGQFEKVLAILDEIDRRGLSETGTMLSGSGGELGLQEAERVLRTFRERANAAGVAAEGAADGLDAQGDAALDAAGATDALSSSLDLLSARQRLTALGFDANAAAADSFRSALDRASGGASLLSAGLGMGGALAELREGLFGDPDDLTDPVEELAKQVNPAQEALDRLSDAAERADPSMTALGISLGSTSAAADAFRDALEDSSWMDDLAGHAISIGRAFKDMRLNLRNLPPTFDLARASLGQYEDGQLDAIQSMFQLGESTQDYLATLMRSGRPLDDMRAEAGRLRDAFMAQFTAMGLTTEQAQEYLAMLGLTPDQIETSIKLSGAEKARFQINAYLQLLEGRIPPEVATNVAALIEQGDLDSAAAALADWAKTGPGKVDLSLWDPEEADEAKQDLAQLPGVIDPIKAAMGGYNDEQMRGIELALAFGDATREFLAGLVAAGRGDEVPAALESAKAQFTAIGLAAGLSQESVDGLWATMGLAPGTVETALKISGVDKALFQIQTYVDLLGEQIPPEVASQVLAAVDEGNLEEAARILNEWRVNNPQIFETGANPDGFVKRMMDLVLGTNRGDFGTPQVPVDADTSRARAAIQALVNDPIAPIYTFLGIPRPNVGTPRPGGSPNGWFNERPRFHTGGIVPGVGNTDSVLAMLMPGEFVVRKEMVKRLGLDFMHRLNSGALPGFAAGGEVPRYFGMPGARDAAYARLRGVERPRYMTATTELAGGARSGGVTVDIDATYNQVERAPSADELARRVREELVVGGYG